MSGLVIDFAHLEPWQWLFGAIGVLGLSPAPWILGLALGRLQFTKTAQANYAARAADLISANDKLLGAQNDYHAKILAEKDKTLDERTESRDYYREARLETAGQNQRLTEALIESIEVAHTGTRALDTIAEVAKGATP